MVQPIQPFARELFVCESYVPRERGKIDFLRAFHAISPQAYPYTLADMCVVAHLSGGLGVVNTYFDIRHAQTMALVATTVPRGIAFPDRSLLVRLAQAFKGVHFERPGVYLIELYCEHACIADTSLHLRNLSPALNGEHG